MTPKVLLCVNHPVYSHLRFPVSTLGSQSDDYTSVLVPVLLAIVTQHNLFVTIFFSVDM